MMILSIDHLAGLSGSCPLIVYDQITPVQYEVLSVFRCNKCGMDF